MLKTQELSLRNELEQMDRNNENRLKAQPWTFNEALKDLKADARERHVLFVKDVKTVHENVHLNIEELRMDMVKEVKTLDHNDFSLHNKVDIIVDVVTKIVETYNSLSPKVDKKAKIDSQSFEMFAKVMADLKELISKFSSSSSSMLTQDFLSQKFRLLESSIKNELAPLAKFVNLMPTNAPPIHTRVQGGERNMLAWDQG